MIDKASAGNVALTSRDFTISADYRWGWVGVGAGRGEGVGIFWEIISKGVAESPLLNMLILSFSLLAQK
jgi:hypothetical protein